MRHGFFAYLWVSVSHTVQPGDCIFSIAEEYGYHWETIWKDGSNTSLRQLRKSPAVIAPGDSLTIPDKQLKNVDRPTDQTHKFVRLGTPAKLRLQFLRDGEPRAGEPYTLNVDGVIRSGNTDGEGFVTEYLPPKARRGELIIGQGDDQMTYPLQLGHLDPIDSDTGASQRLSNLGVLPPNADPSDAAARAHGLRQFQATHGLPITGEADEATKAKLKTLHGS